MNIKSRFFLTLILLANLRLATAQNNWPEFRGPDGNGYAVAHNLPTEFSETKNILWKTAVMGKAWSSPVIWDNQIWLTNATEDGTKMSVICLDLKTGNKIYDLVLFENTNPDFCHPTNSYASPTPVIEEGRLYAHFGSFGTACVDTQSGKILWKQIDLECNHFRGPGSSPILFDDLLIVALDGFDQQYVVGLDTKTGKIVWKTKRDIEYGSDNGDNKKAYSTGSIFEVDGEPLLIYPSAVATEAFEPRTGKRKWIVYHGGMNASARPVMHEGLVFITNGMGQMMAVRASGNENNKGDITETNIVWRQSKSVAKKSSLLLVDDLLYMIDDRGIFSALEPESGETVWRKRIGGSFAASPIYADGKIWLCSIEGKVLVFQPGRKFQPIAENELGDGFMASPAVAGNRLILRSKSAVYCVGIPGE